MSVIGILEIDLHAPGCNSLKEKRSVVKRLTASIRRTFNASVSETFNNGLLQRAGLTVAVVGNDRAHLDAELSRIMNRVLSNGSVDVIESSVSFAQHQSELTAYSTRCKKT